MKICSIDGCGRQYSAKGLCKIHYMRMWKNGDPLLVRRPRGEAQKFYTDVVLPYSGDDCLIWPFSRNRKGYGTVRRNGYTGIASHFVCQDTRGPRPSLDHEAAHSCGNGGLGCVTKGHISWKTRVENQADRLIHDTHIRGERNYSAKLTEAQAREILALKDLEPRREIAKRYGVSQRSIYSIHKGKKWSWLSESAEKEQRNASAA